MSTNSIGSDLDTRPIGMARNATLEAIQHCSECGFCAVDLTFQIENAKQIVDGESYQLALKTEEFPELARYWMCNSILFKHSKQYAASGWSSLHAAWAFDDSDSSGGSDLMRRQTIESWEECKGDNSFDTESVDVKLLLCDLHRRLQDFDIAANIAMAVKERVDDSQGIIANFQIYLSEKYDDRRYTVANANRFAKKGENWNSKKWWQIWK